MARLELSFLGPFRVVLDGEPVTGFESNKVRALLAYLAVEGDCHPGGYLRPHSRGALAGLLWPGWPERAARNNLRNALSNLRKAIGDRDAELPFLTITRETIQFNEAGDYWLDVRAFQDLAQADPQDPSASRRWAEGVALYCGRFLEGFSVHDSPAFEDWALLVGEQLQRQALMALGRLAAYYERQGEYGQACDCAWRQVALEPCDERAHRQVMRLLAASGQQGAALSQYETCRRLLEEELGAEPSAETTALYERIRSGSGQAQPLSARPRTPRATLPTGTVTFLFTDIEGSTPLWEQKPGAMRASVARHHAILRGAIESNGGVVFKIVGDAFQAAFDLASSALRAVLDAQRALRDQEWGATGPLRVRMGLHTGPAELERGGESVDVDYAVSHTLNRAARVMSAGHGGQILISQEAADLVSRELPPGISLKDMGEHRPKGMALYEHLYQVLAPDLPQAFPPLATEDRRSHNLPTQTTPFIGRETLLAEVHALLARPKVRLLTLTGPGGSGKTRLALETARGLLSAGACHRYPDGIYFVSLAPLRSMDAIAPAIAQALGLLLDRARSAAGSGPLRPLLDYLRQRRLLLILDNVEHLLARPPSDRADAAQVVVEVLRAAPEVTILATSRARLNVQGEHLLSIPGMDVPPDPVPGRAEAGERPIARYSAVRLFVESARRLQPGYQPLSEDLARIAHICRLLGGMPLAILMAAAWMRTLSPAEIAAEIAGELGQGVDFLGTDWHGVPARQRSMRAVFDHSYALLSEGQREILGVLSVFRGSFARRAAQAVTGASLRQLAALVDMSLLQRTPSGHYVLHELLRQYAAEKLDASEGETRAARDRHAAYYAAAMQRWSQDLKGNRDRAAQIEIEQAFEDVRAAWEWAIERHEVNWLGQALEGLRLFCVFRRRTAEGEAMSGAAAEALCAREAGPPAPAETLRVASRLLSVQAWFQGEIFDKSVAEKLAQRSLALLAREELADTDTRSERAFALLAQVNALGYHRTDARDVGYDEASKLCERSVALYQALGDRYSMGLALITWATICGRYGDWVRAQQMSEQALALYRALGNNYGIESAFTELVWDAGNIGQFEKAERLARRSLTMRQKGSEADIGTGLMIVGLSLSWCGRYAEAGPVLQESVDIWAKLGLQARYQMVTWWLAWTETHLGLYGKARARAHAALDRSRESDLQKYEADAYSVLTAVALAEEAYGEAWRLQQGRPPLIDSTQFGPLALGGYTARGLGRTVQAQRLLWEGFRQAADTRSVPRLLASLPGVALALADCGNVERAVEVYALATRYAMVANSRWFEDVAGRHIAAAAKALPPDTVAAAQERGRARDLWATAQELLAELGDKT
jgi:predicted ATPase/DNA-binding SARP family transcriptional activator